MVELIAIMIGLSAITLMLTGTIWISTIMWRSILRPSKIRVDHSRREMIWDDMDVEEY